jgi:NAD-dependent deacetylase
MPGVLHRIAAAIARAERVTVLTGAGISTESGIPDFRGPQGIWTRDPAAERQATLDAWITDSDLRRAAWRFRLEHRDAAFEPNAGHRALVELERLGRLHTLVTQNVDGLHLQAGTSRGRLVEIHGSYRDVVCLSCGTHRPMDEVLDRVAGGEPDPRCEFCGGLLKSATISFGQALDPGDLERARRAAEDADVFLALGTSLAVYPVAALPDLAGRRGAFVAILNGQPTELDHVADALLIGRLGELLPDLVTIVRAQLGRAGR